MGNEAARLHKYGPDQIRSELSYYDVVKKNY